MNWASLVAHCQRLCLSMQETWVHSLDQEDPLEKEMATQYSCLGNPMDREVWQATGSQGGHKSQTQLSD